MANPSKQKGTGGETELRHLLLPVLPGLHRTPPASKWDLQADRNPEAFPIQVLATRPDHGTWLVTMRIGQFFDLLRPPDEQVSPSVHIEVKRYKRFSLHTIFERKFGQGL